MQIKYVISDFGGVLLDFDFYDALRQLGSRIPSQELFQYIIQGEPLRRFELGLTQPHEFQAEVMRIAEVDLPFEEFSTIWTNIFQLKEDVLKLLANIRSHHQLFMLSNTNSLVFPVLLRRFPAVDIFNYYFLSFQLHLLKPDPRIFEATLQKLGAKPSECLFIDDTAKHVAAAQTLGIDAIQFTGAPALQRAITDRGLL